MVASFKRLFQGRGTLRKGPVPSVDSVRVSLRVFLHHAAVMVKVKRVIGCAAGISARRVSPSAGIPTQ